ncbi:MAG: hypothetical protein ACLFU8_10285 [Anaerolineales bacterium]
MALLATGNVPELETEPLAIAFHLAAELATAVALLFAGVGLLRRARWATSVTRLALGMLLYTVINSAGYFAEQGAWWRCSRAADTHFALCTDTGQGFQCMIR